MNKTAVKKVIDPLFGFLTNRLYFCIVYFLASALRSIVPILPVADIFMKVCFVWGIGLLAWDFFGKRAMFKGYKSVLLFVFMVLNAVSLVTNMTALYSVVKQFIYNGILLLIFYPAGEDGNIEKQKKVLTIGADIYIFVFMIVSAISIGMYLARSSYIAEVGGFSFFQGTHFNRLTGIYINSNTGATVSPCAIALSLIIFSINREHFRRLRVFYILSTVIQFVFFTLTLSNGGMLAFMAGLGIAAVVLAFPYFKAKHKIAKSLLLSAASLVCAVLVFLGATHVSRTAIVTATNFISSIGSDSDGTPGEDGDADDEDEVVLERTDKNNRFGNGRLDIWSAGLIVLKQRPVFGWGDAAFYNEDVKIVPIDDSLLNSAQLKVLKASPGHMHNAIIQIVVCGGVAGLAAFLLFAILAAARYIKSLFRFFNTKYYYPLATVFCLLAVLISQAAAEAHILYVSNDPFACMFWLFLGFGMMLIKDTEKQTAEGFAFMADTPLQVMNATAFVKNNEMGSAGKSDIFIYHQFRGSYELAERLEKEGVFRKVYNFRKIDFGSGIAKKLRTLDRVLRPAPHLKKIYCGEDTSFLNNNYKYLCISFFTPFSDLLHCRFTNTEAVQIEDGLGSYVTPDLEARYRSGLFDKVNNILLGGRLSYNPKALWLCTPELSVEHDLPIEKLGSIATNKELLETADKVFDYKENPIYAQNRVVYLDQPVYDRPEAETIKKNEAAFLPLIAEADPIVRLHPRQTENAYEGFRRDTAGNMWELECANSIGDDHVLMGLFSTAQFTPKMMFGTEPTLVFLYKLFGCNFDNTEGMIERIRSAYTNKDKIIVVETEEELKAILETIRKGDSFGK